MFPFFLNFAGQSPLDIALQKYDLHSFQFLIDQLIQVQECFDSSHLVDNVLIQALEKEIDL